MPKIVHQHFMYDLVVKVTAPLPGPFEDWPANIQDGVLTALAQASLKNGENLSLIGAVCRPDPDGGWMVVAQARGPDRRVQ